MSLAVLRSRALAGMEALAVSVEVHLANGLSAWTSTLMSAIFNRAANRCCSVPVGSLLFW